MQRNKYILNSGIAVILIFALLLVGCGDEGIIGDVQGGSQFEQIIGLSSSPSDIELGAESTVSGMVTDSSGTGLANKQVVLSVVPQTAGYFLPAAVLTYSDGSFSSQFTPLDTGSVQIVATTSANATASYSTAITASNGYQAGTWRFEFEVNPTWGLADGTDVSNVEVEIWDGNNNPVAPGVIVMLEAGERFEDVDGDGYFTENVDYVLVDINSNGIWDRIGTVPKTVTTSDGGISFNYTAGTVAGLIYLRATVIDDNDNLNFSEFPMVLRPSDDIASIALTADRSEIQVKATGGMEFANLTASCYDAFGNKVQSEVPVDFFIVYGPGGGERLTISEYDSTVTSADTFTAVTNVIGEASVTLLSGIKSGTILLQAKNGDVFSNSTLLSINAGPPFELSVGVDPCNIRGWDRINVQASVVVLVDDKYGNPVMDNTEVFFWTDEGMVEAGSITIDGIGSSVYHSGDPRDDGLAWIRAETVGGTLVDSTLLIVSGPAVYVTAFGYASDLNADGEDYTDIWVDARDINNNFMVDGTGVEILLSDASIITGTLEDGCFGSLVRLRYKSKTLSRDYEYSVPDNGVGRIVTGGVQVGGVNGPSSNIMITLHTGISNSTSSELKIETTVAPGSSVPLDVIIKDRAGNPLGGHLIVPSANLGAISPATGISNAYGEVAFVYTAPGAIGNDYISIEDQDPGYGGMIMTKKIKLEVSE
jgi:hypothetical protein